MKENQVKLKLDGCEEGSISSQSFYFPSLQEKVSVIQCHSGRCSRLGNWDGFLKNFCFFCCPSLFTYVLCIISLGNGFLSTHNQIYFCICDCEY
jgi:hypothetical protein